MSKTIKQQSASGLDAETFFSHNSQHGDATVIVNSIELKFTNLHKIFWPGEGYTKFDLLKYYYTISETILPYIKSRPLILKRYPNGITGQMFYQHNLEDAPHFIAIYTKREPDGKLVHNPVANNLAALLYLVNLGTIAQNPWFSRMEAIHKPDYIAFDLDPGADAGFEQVKKIALEIKDLLDEVGITGYPKTSGSRGIHIYVPIEPKYTYDEIFPIAKQFAAIIAVRNPKEATIRRMIHDRTSAQVYIDYLQNMEGKSMAAPYSVREKPHAMVSAPLDWSEITKNLSLEQFTMKTLPARIAQKGDLFGDLLLKRQILSNLLKKIEEIH
jgi:bifunctional non-homologous end joining protein LigD